MSDRGRGGRGRGRGRGGRGQGQPEYDQPFPSTGRGSGRGHPRPSHASPTVSSASDFPALSSQRPVQQPRASTGMVVLSQELQQKMTLQSGPSTSQTMARKQQESKASSSSSLSAPPPPPPPPAETEEKQPQSLQPVQDIVRAPSSSKAFPIPRRPNFGTAGRKCLVRANHFLVQVADLDLNHYDVSISPEIASKKVCKEIIKKLSDRYRDSDLNGRQLAYDGRKSAYTAGELPFSSKEFVVALDNQNNRSRRVREFRVAIKFAAKVDLYHLKQFLCGRQLDAPQETIQALDVALRMGPSFDSNYEVVGRSFYSATLIGKGPLANGVEYWMGFYQSLRPSQMGLSLNIDISARAFFEPILVSEFVAKYLNIRDMRRPLSDQDRVKVKRAVRGLKVQITYGDNVRRYKISGISVPPISQLTFTLDDVARTTSVVQYYREKYNMRLQFASLPALQAGNDAKPIYLPMELCRIVDGQRFTKKLNDRQVDAMLRATCQRPREREHSIKNIAQSKAYDGEGTVRAAFGIQVTSDLAQIDARVLGAPRLKYHDTGKESRVIPRVGQWNMIDKKMINGGRIDYWACVSFSRENVDWALFCEALVSMCCSKGMVFNSRPLIPTQYANSGQIERTLYDIHAQCTAQLKGMSQMGKHLQLLIVILPDFSGSYGRIKRICETELGIVSQCCKPHNAKKGNKQYLENLSLKINVKVGGRNTVLMDAIERKIPFVTDRPTIIFGADVTHPQPGEDSNSSIAAVVASMDWPEVTKYKGLVCAQSHREEIIQDLYSESKDPQRGIIRRGMVRELLISFRKYTGHKPDRIIFYRDGVSEGQFNQVLLHEMDAIRKACVSLEENYLPRITFIVVQKRHHTRLFPANHGDHNSTDRSGNILPGTVVDTKICHPTEFDFFLCSHSGIQGTSRPAHYHVLYDENNFSADALQTLTNNLCYTYARCTRSVSIVPPAYYAHLTAFRARYYCEDMTSESGSIVERESREGAMVVRPLPAIKDNVKEVMFYC